MPEGFYLAVVLGSLASALLFPPLLAVAFYQRSEWPWKPALAAASPALAWAAFAVLVFGADPISYVLAAVAAVSAPAGAAFAVVRAARGFREDIVRERARAAGPPTVADQGAERG